MSDRKITFEYNNGVVSRTDNYDAVIVSGVIQQGACGLTGEQIADAFALWFRNRPTLPDGWTLAGLDGKNHVRSPNWESYFEIKKKTADEFEHVAKWIRDQLGYGSNGT